MKTAVVTARIRERLSFEGIFLLIFLAAIILRFYTLDLKLFHHDEAIHAWFSYKLLTEGTYIYDPMYHGPLRYYVTAGMFALFGDSDLVGRLIPALLGTLLVPLLYPIYRLGYLDKKQTLVAALFLAVSPNMVYFSRFLRDDPFIIFFTMVLLIALLYYFERQKTRYALLAGAAVGLGMSTMENMPIVILIFGAYLLYLVWTGKVRLPTRWVRDLALGVLLAVGIAAVFYSSFGAHPEMVLDWWLRAIEHWTAMHQMQRLGGPPYFYILLFILYELPILLLAIVGVFQFINIPALVSQWRERKSRHAGTPEDGEGAEEAEEGVPEVAAPPPIQPQGWRDRLREILSGGGEIRPIDRQKEFARFAIFWTQAVECLGENSSSRGLAHATRANKQICMRGTLHTNSIFQSLNDMILSNDIGKTLWPPFSCDYLIFTHITLQKKLNFDPAKCVSQRIHVPIWTSAAIAIFIAIDARFMVRAINN